MDESKEPDDTPSDPDSRDKLWQIKYNFTDSQLSELKECFYMLDTTGSGVIAAHSLGTALRAMGQNPTEADLQELLQDAALDDNGNMGLEEYVRLVGSRGLRSEDEMKDELEEALRVFDKMGEGCVDAVDLKQTLTTLGEPIDDSDIAEMLKVAEVAGDGKINYYEFMKKLMS